MFNLFSSRGAKIRTRFAPSPTGYLHIGSLRTALYSYLFARQNQGDFILRLEDTDQSREVPGAVDNLIKILAWSGLDYQEGLFIDSQGKIVEKGHFGPYKQSQRLDLYQKYAQKLLAQDQAYHCFCSAERLEKLRQEQEAAGQPTKYDWHCRSLTPEEVQQKITAGQKYVIRMKVPEAQEIVFQDGVRGEVRFETKEIDDQVLIKSDGFPTYHLANVVDDRLMKITHVIRGEEWLPSTPKHILLYQFFGWSAPQFVHLPLILNPDKSKLSKRQGDVAVEDYQKQGYLPEALLNFVALLGWNPGTEQEIFSLDELAKIFDLKKIHKAGAVFNREKLDWLNGEYLKKLPPADFIVLAKPFLQANFPQAPADIDQNKILLLEQQRLARLEEVGQAVKFLLVEKIAYEPKILIWKKSDQKQTKKNLELLAQKLKPWPAGEWTKEKLENELISFIKQNNLTNGEILWPLRVALTGQEKSPTPFEVAEILGPAKTLARIEQASQSLN